MAASIPHCAHHPDTVATWRCRRCKRALCAACPTEQAIRQVVLRSCPDCGEPGRLEALEDVDREPAMFRRLVREAPVYPLVGRGRYVLLGAVLLCGAYFLAWDVFIADLIFGALLTLYVAAYAIEVLRVSSTGEAEPPEWPDYTRFYGEIVLPTGHLLFSAVVAFGPAALADLFAPAGLRWLRLPLLVAGGAYWPMAVLALGLHRTLESMAPWHVLAAMVKVPRAYAVTVAMVWAAGAVGLLVPTVVPWGVLAFVVGLPLQIYALTVAMRVIGVLYYAHRHTLRWFDE